MRRYRWLVGLLIVLAGPGAWSPARADDVANPYFPYRAGLWLRYRATTTLDEQGRFEWRLTHQKTVPGPAGTERVTYRLLGQGWDNGRLLERQESFLRDGRGVFAVPRADGTFGPAMLLPGPVALASPDTVWAWSGDRGVPFGLNLLGLAQRNPEPVPTDGLYHRLSHGPLETAAGRFAEAVQVTAVESVTMLLTGQEPESVLFRARRFYVAELGLVREQLMFLDHRQLGVLTTDLIAWGGAAPKLAEAPAPRTDLTDESSNATGG